MQKLEEAWCNCKQSYKIAQGWQLACKEAQLWVAKWIKYTLWKALRWFDSRWTNIAQPKPLDQLK